MVLCSLVHPNSLRLKDSTRLNTKAAPKSGFLFCNPTRLDPIEALVPREQTGCMVAEPLQIGLYSGTRGSKAGLDAKRVD
jgi:hypothetical protein